MRCAAVRVMWRPDSRNCCCSQLPIIRRPWWSGGLEACQESESTHENVQSPSQSLRNQYQHACASISSRTCCCL